MIEIKSLLEGLNRRSEQAEGNIRQLTGRPIEIFRSKSKRKRNEENEQRSTGLPQTHQHTHTESHEKRREKGAEGIFEDIISEKENRYPGPRSTVSSI